MNPKLLQPSKTTNNASFSQAARRAFWHQYFEWDELRIALSKAKQPDFTAGHKTFYRLVNGLSGKGAMTKEDREVVEAAFKKKIESKFVVRAWAAQEFIEAWIVAYRRLTGRNFSTVDVINGIPWQADLGLFNAVDSPSGVDLGIASPVSEMVAGLKAKLNELRRHNGRYKDYGKKDSCEDAFHEKPWLLKNCPDFIGERQLLDLLASLFEWAGDWANAAGTLGEFAKLQRWVVDPIYEARVLLRLAWALYETGQYDKTIETGHAALDRLNQLKKSVKGHTDIRTRARLCDVLGLAYLRKGRINPSLLSQAVKKTREALKLRKAIGAQVGIAATKIRLGIIYIGLNDKRAMNTLKKAYALALSHGAAAFACGARYNMAVIHLRGSQWYDALCILSECVEEQQRCGDEAGLAKSHNLLAVLWFHMAFQLPVTVTPATDQTPVPESIHLARSCPIVIEDWQAIAHIGSLHVRHHWMWKKAAKHLDECMKRAKAWCRPEIFASACIGKGWQELVDDHVPEAEKYLRDAQAHLDGRDEARDLLHSKFEAFELALRKKEHAKLTNDAPVD